MLATLGRSGVWTLASRAALALCAAAALCAAVPLAAASPARADDKYAAIVVDVATGETLHEANADARRYPASLTKMMTIYVAFEELAAGTMRLDTPMSVSAYAAGRPPTKIGVRAGGTLKVSDAIKALITKSANDASVVLAEHIGGTEAAFAKRMTKTARRLGMSTTTFRNANGLPDNAQVTTARDMAVLGIALQRDFPQYYGVFSTRSFKWGKRTFGNHNRLLGSVQGVDGIKTGYIRASGFNLVSSVRRGDRHIVAVVMGGKSAASRDAQMKKLIAAYMPKASDDGSPILVARWTDRTPPPLPGAKPPLARLYAERLLARAEEPDPIAATLFAFAAEARAGAALPDDAAAGIVAPSFASGALAAVIAQAGSDPAEEAPAGLTAVAYAPEAVVVPSPSSVTVDPRFGAAFATVEGSGRNGLAEALARAALARAKAPSGTSTIAIAIASAPPPPPPVAPRGWQIQVGAVGSAEEAELLLDAAAEREPSLVLAQRVTIPVRTGAGTLYRARFAGFASQAAAEAACERFANHDQPCWAVAM